MNYLQKSENFLFFAAIKDITAGEEIVYDYQFDNDKEEFIKLD
jgi:SET domain-containing protein